MFEVLFAHIEGKIHLTDQEKERIKPLFISRKLRRRQYLLQAEEICTHLTFVTKGLLRSYNVDDKGNEHINQFAWEGWWISDFYSFLTQEKAIFNIDAIEETEVLMISLQNYEELTVQVPAMDRYFRILYQNSLVTKDRRLMSSTTHTAEEKYLQFAKRYAQILQRIPQHLVASYLGLAPETISRIRRKWVSKEAI